MDYNERISLFNSNSLKLIMMIVICIYYTNKNAKSIIILSYVNEQYMVSKNFNIND